MNKAVLFKILQRKFRFRNPSDITGQIENLSCAEKDIESAQAYIEYLEKNNISYSYPGGENYPDAFKTMKEAPLFFEYIGEPLWKNHQFMSVVGSREMSSITEQWLKAHLTEFLKNEDIGVVSGGAKGVDQLAHLIAIKNNRPTVFVLPSGLMQMYPKSLEDFKSEFNIKNICFVSEFESHQRIQKTHFYLRNRLIAALGMFTLVPQASLKSGSLLTVHHCLEMGRPVVSVPAHPEMIGFDGNLKLLFDGAQSIRNFSDLHDFWMSEKWPY